MITITPTAMSKLRPGMQREPQTYHYMPSCQSHDDSINNYVLRSCKTCDMKYRKEFCGHDGMGVYANNVLTSHGAEARPRFLNPDGDNESGTETLGVPNQESETADTVRRRSSTPKTSPAVPKRAPAVPKAKQTSLRHAQVIQGRVVLGPILQTAEVITGTPVAPRSPTSTINSIGMLLRRPWVIPMRISTVSGIEESATTET